MQQIFVKTIHSKQVEFSRLLYPLRYKLFVRIENKNPLIAEMQRNEKNEWHLQADEETLPTVAVMENELIETILENEAKSVAVAI